ncbi:putative magnesium transporter MRS2 [Helianthus annuus]|nr:putative magnesium transporter MRS2 [Helianthus annuus]
MRNRIYRPLDDGYLFPKPPKVCKQSFRLNFKFWKLRWEVVCTYLDSSVADLERDAYPVLDELAKNVSTKNLERVRDELEHLLDDDEDMTQLYLTRKWLQNQQSEVFGWRRGVH